MSFLTKISGIDKRKRDANARRGREWAPHGGDPNEQLRTAVGDELEGEGWKNAFNDTAGAVYERMMPQFRDDMQLTREQGIRRGISTGDLGTSYEGDLASAFSGNLANTFGGMAMQGYENNRNRYLDLLTGTLDRNRQSRDWWKTALGAGVRAGATFAGGRGG